VNSVQGDTKPLSASESKLGPRVVALYLSLIALAMVVAVWVAPNASFPATDVPLPLRWPVQLLELLLRGLARVVGDRIGVAIVLLSLTVRLLFLPLTLLAERWQQTVDAQRTRLEPALTEIRQRFRGEERSREIFELYRAEGISLFYGLRSLLGIAIQLPLFLAACYLLELSPLLSAERFLWVSDLSRPDVLPGAFGSLWRGGPAVHGLPLLMTAAACLAARLHAPAGLGPDGVRKQRRGLYALALLFLFLLYVFPAGLVLYWSVNNFVSLGRVVMQRWRDNAGPVGEDDSSHGPNRFAFMRLRRSRLHAAARALLR